MTSFLKYFKRYLFRKPRFLNLFFVRLRNINSFIASTANIQGTVLIGLRSSVGHYSTLVVADDPHVSTSKKDTSSLSIGDDTYIGECNNIRACGGSITIGNKCLISQHITIVSSNHGIEKRKPIIEQAWIRNNNFVIIEDDVWVGANSVILPGVTIHQGAVVAAGSIVTKDIPEYAIVAGNPARIIKYRE